MKKKELEEIENIMKTFPVLLTDDIYEASGNGTLPYKSSAVSVFSKWLGEDEAAQVPFLSNTSEADIRYLELEKKFIDFYSRLYDLYELYIFFSDHDILNLYKADNKDEFIKCCIGSIREKDFLSICIPEKKCFIAGAYDLTNILYYPEVIELTELIESFNLYVLPMNY